MQTLDSIKQLVSEIRYTNWDILVRQYGDGRPYIQVQFDAPCSNTGIIERQYCRKHALSLYMTNSEIIRTAYKAVRDAVLHEMDEEFRFRGERIMSPHMDYEKLVEFMKTTPTSKREG